MHYRYHYFLGSLIDQLEKVGHDDHSLYDSFILFVISHGTDFTMASPVKIQSLMGSNVIISSDMVAFDCNIIFNLFTGASCPSLLGKPKIFFMDFCRGSQFSDESHLFRTSDLPFINLPTATTSTFSNTADFVICYSTIFGQLSYSTSYGVTIY